MSGAGSIELVVGESGTRRIANVLRALFYGWTDNGLDEIGTHADRERWIALARSTGRVEWTFDGKRRVLVRAEALPAMTAEQPVKPFA